MIKTVSKKKSIDVLDDIICDSCGESCKKINYDYLKITGSFGYGSKKDGETWTAEICEKCVDEKLSFIKFRTEDNITFGNDDKNIIPEGTIIIQEFGK